MWLPLTMRRKISLQQKAGRKKICHVKGQRWDEVSQPKKPRGQCSAKISHLNKPCKQAWSHQSVTSWILFMLTERERHKANERTGPVSETQYKASRFPSGNVSLVCLTKPWQATLKGVQFAPHLIGFGNDTFKALNMKNLWPQIFN